MSGRIGHGKFGSVRARLQEASALAHQEVEKTQMLVKLFVSLHDVDKNEMPHGSGVVSFAWTCPLYGRHVLSQEVKPSVYNKKHLATNPKEMITGDLSIEPMLNFSQRMPFDSYLIRIKTYPDASSRKKLFVYDNNMKPWEIRFQFTEKGVLSEVEVIYDSDEHPEFVKYVEQVVFNNTREFFMTCGT